MSAGHDPAVAAAHARFAPKATGLLRHREWTRSANRDLMHRSKMRRYSITPSARPESGTGTLMPGQFAFRS
jgi:hypothetical protein